MGIPTYFTSADIADYLEVSRVSVTNWIHRYPNEIPQPSAQTLAGIRLYDDAAFQAWLDWYAKRVDLRADRRANSRINQTCPKCGAEPGQPCISHVDGLPLQIIHKERGK